MKALGYNVGTVSPTVLCKLFEDNIGLLTFSRSPSMRPGTKHNNLKYRHLRAYVANSTLSILPIESYKQPAGMIMHLLNENAFIRNIISILGWRVLQEGITCWGNQSRSRPRGNWCSKLKSNKYKYIYISTKSATFYKSREGVLGYGRSTDSKFCNNCKFY